MHFKHWQLTILLPILLCNCTLTQRGMLGSHTYHSSYSPNIRIDVDDRFVYYQDSDASNRHNFIEKEAHREVIIEFISVNINERQVEHFYNPLTWIFYDFKSSEEIAKGETEIIGKKWYYRDLVHHQSTASCYLMRDIGLFTENYDVLKVLYVQELPPYQCRTWKDLGTLNDKQQIRFERFLQNMTQDLQISPYVPD